MGYGSRAISLLLKYFRGNLVSMDEADEEDEEDGEVDEVGDEEGDQADDMEGMEVAGSGSKGAEDTTSALRAEKLKPKSECNLAAS